MKPLAKALLALAALLAASSSLPAEDTPPAASNVTRVAASLNGVFSPRGFFNILVPLERFQGVKAVKLDLNTRARITIDFAPGHTITQDQIHQVIVEAGYRPGPITIDSLPESQAVETGPGWMPIKHPTARSAFGRWAQINF